MAVEWEPIVAGAVAGAGTGFITTVIAPWTNWGIEKRREQRAARVKLIADGRDMLARRLDEGNPFEIIYEPAYNNLRRYLTDERRQRVERTHRVAIVDGVRGLRAQDPLAAVAEQLDELEKQWGLP